jgi:hypothetical protein
MLTLAAGDTIAGVAAAATSITYTIFGMELNAGIESYKILAQGQLPSSAAVLYTAPAGSQIFVKSMHLTNTTGATVGGVKLFKLGTAAGNQITGSFSIPGNGWATYEEDGWKVYNTAGEQLITGITPSGSGGAARAFPYKSGNWYALPDTVMDFSTGGSLFAPNQMHGIPFFAPKDMTIKAIGTFVTTGQASANTQFAVYASDSVTGYPTGPALSSTSNVSTSASGAKSQLLGAPVALTGGALYWIFVNGSVINQGYLKLAYDVMFPQAVGDATLTNILGNVNPPIGGLKSTNAVTFGTWPNVTTAGTTWTLIFATASPFFFIQIN